MVGMEVTCLAFLTNYITISDAPTADKRVAVYGSNIKNVGMCEVGGLQHIKMARWA